MSSIDKGAVANQLVTHALIAFLVKKGVIDEAEYIEYVEALKNTSIQSTENVADEDQDSYKDFIKGVFDGHIADIKNK